MIISWSDIPGAFIDDLMSDGFDVSMMSRRLFPLMGVSCI
jgi:hypothetical protein